MYIGFHVQYPLFSSDFIENPSSGSRLVPCGRTDMTKLIVTFRTFANAPKNG